MCYLTSIRSSVATTAAGLALAALPALQPGCQEEKPPPHAGQIVAGPAEGRVEHAPDKPLPEPGRDELPGPPFVDVPLVRQSLPEQEQFLRAYNGVHRPRIAVFVNRTLEGELIPATDGRPQPERTDRVITRAPGYTSDHTDTYLRPGEYDEAWAKTIDYAAIETALTDWLSADHQATVVSPTTVRARLNDAEVARLQQGRPRELNELAKDLDADILVQVQARPTRQTPRGTTGVGIRLIAEAVNVNHGESIARAQTTMPPPLDAPEINDYTRFLARKLMSDMVATWSSPGPSAPATPPAGDQPPRSELPPAPAPETAPPSEPIVPPTPAESPASPNPQPTGGTDIPVPPAPAPAAPVTPAPPAAPEPPRTLNPYDLPEVKPAQSGTASSSGARPSDARLAPAPADPDRRLVTPAPTTAPQIVLPEVPPTTGPAADQAAPTDKADKPDKPDPAEKPGDPFKY